MKAALRLALLLLFAPAAGVSHTRALDDDSVWLVRTMQSAQQALDAGQPLQAEQLYREICERQPGYAEAHGGLAFALRAQGRGAEALAILLQVGQSLLYGGNGPVAREYLEQAVAIDPRSAAARAALGHCLLVERDYERATSELERAAELGERSPAVRIFLGAALWESGRIEDSERIYREVLASGGRSLAALQSLGGLLLWQGRYVEAAELLAEARRADPDSTQLALDQARALDGAGRVDPAIAAYRRLLQSTPGLYAARYNLALLLRKTGQDAQAQAEMERFRDAHAVAQRETRRRTLQRARVDYGWELIRAGKSELAAAHFRELGDDAEALSGLAAAYEAVGDARGAAGALERALTLAPERQDLRLRLTRVRLGAGSAE